MQLMRQTTLAVACMALSSAALGQVQGIYVVPDTKTGGNAVIPVALRCDKLDPYGKSDASLTCTYIAQPKAVKLVEPKKPDMLFFYVVDPRTTICVWDPNSGRWIPPGCRP